MGGINNNKKHSALLKKGCSYISCVSCFKNANLNKNAAKISIIILQIFHK